MRTRVGAKKEELIKNYIKKGSIKSEVRGDCPKVGKGIVKVETKHAVLRFLLLGLGSVVVRLRLLDYVLNFLSLGIIFESLFLLFSLPLSHFLQNHLGRGVFDLQNLGGRAYFDALVVDHLP